MNYLQIDLNPLQKGYVVVNCNKATARELKLKVIKGNYSVHYAIKNKEYIPLQFGNGKYNFILYENIAGTRYTSIGKRTIEVKLNDAFAPFLNPNQYVWYTNESDCLIKAQELCANALNAEEKLKAIETFIKQYIIYDYIKAVTIKKSVLPNIDECYNKRKGICQDIAALMVAMLRSQGIASSLIIGYADKNYHAWVKVYWNKNKVETYDPTAWVMHKKNAKSYTEERWY